MLRITSVAKFISCFPAQFTHLNQTWLANWRVSHWLLYQAQPWRTWKMVSSCNLSFLPSLIIRTVSPPVEFLSVHTHAPLDALCRASSCSLRKCWHSNKKIFLLLRNCLLPVNINNLWEQKRVFSSKDRQQLSVEMHSVVWFVLSHWENWSQFHPAELSLVISGRHCSPVPKCSKENFHQASILKINEPLWELEVQLGVL